MSNVCPECGGDQYKSYGPRMSEPCHRCGGSGYVDPDERLHRAYGDVSVRYGRPTAEHERSIASHAALRDRLARAEGRCVALEEAIRMSAYRLDMSGLTKASVMRAAVAKVVIELRADLTAPTDGAARAGDAAGDEGGTT